MNLSYKEFCLFFYYQYLNFSFAFDIKHFNFSLLSFLKLFIGLKIEANF